MAKKKQSSNNLYSVHPGVAMVVKWTEDLPGRTGRTLDQWVELVLKEGPAETKDRRDWLKKEYGFGTNHAWWIVEKAENKGEPWEGDAGAYLEAASSYVKSMFAGGKEGLRPLYDELLQLAFTIGPDVKACPCKTIVPLYRNHVFAQLKPTTRTRLDLGFSLRGTEPSGRLLATGGEAKGDRITHRIPITCPDDIDAEVQRWLRVAYEGDA